MIGAAQKSAPCEGVGNSCAVGGFYGQPVESARPRGASRWRAHAAEDVMHPTFDGVFAIRPRDREIGIGPGESFIIPRGLEHLPVRAEKRRVTLSEPAATKQYGD